MEISKFVLFCYQVNFHPWGKLLMKCRLSCLENPEFHWSGKPSIINRPLQIGSPPTLPHRVVTTDFLFPACRLLETWRTGPSRGLTGTDVRVENENRQHMLVLCYGDRHSWMVIHTQIMLEPQNGHLLLLLHRCTIRTHRLLWLLALSALRYYPRIQAHAINPHLLLLRDISRHGSSPERKSLHGRNWVLNWATMSQEIAAACCLQCRSTE